MKDNLPFLTEFSNLAGELAKSLSLNRSIGQIYGLLYLSQTPRSLEDIAKTLEMSKGNASVNLRALEAWGAVRSVGVRGSRRDHYEANGNLQEVALRRVHEGLTKRLALAEGLLQHLANTFKENGNQKESPFMRIRLKELQAFLAQANRALTMLPKLKRLL